MHMVRILVWWEVGRVNIAMFKNGARRISSYWRGANIDGRFCAYWMFNTRDVYIWGIYPKVHGLTSRAVKGN